MSVMRVATGVDLYYEWHGEAVDGPPVVFIRGTGADSSRWLPQAEAYRDRYRCLLFDNRGSGKSSAPPGPYSVAMMAADTIALMDELGIETAHLSGLSLGGAIAQHIAVYHPERVATLQLHGTWVKTGGYAAVYLGLLKRFLETGGLDLYYEGAILYLFPPQFFIDNYDRVQVILTSMKEHSSPAEGLLGQLEANLTHDLHDEVGSITAPTLITVGELDMCIPVHYSRELHQLISGSELEIFPGGSHLFGVQDPETFNRVTLGWLDRQVARAQA
jgi:aminoacrylate hydrolase